MKEEVLKALRQAKGYLSGQELGDLLGVSRTAVWKTIQQLTEEGYEIEAVNKKGYRLVDQPDLLTKVEIESRIRPGCIGSHVHFFEEVDSTNNEAKKLAEHGAPEGTLVVAEAQTGGKGRKLRPWSSPAGIGIWMSFVLRPSVEPEKASMMTLLAAMAVYDAVSELGIACGIKWPNDIVIDGRKVCGILTEMSATPDDINYIVTGIGINVHNQSFPEDIAKVAISLDMAIAEQSQAGTTGQIDSVSIAGQADTVRQVDSVSMAGQAGTVGQVGPAVQTQPEDQTGTVEPREQADTVRQVDSVSMVGQAGTVGQVGPAVQTQPEGQMGTVEPREQADTAGQAVSVSLAGQAGTAGQAGSVGMTGQGSSSEPAKRICRSALVARIMESFDAYYKEFLMVQDLSFIVDLYNQRLVNFGQEVYLVEKDRTRNGNCLGIDAHGGLIVQMDGREEHIISGEVSVRGVLGYV